MADQPSPIVLTARQAKALRFIVDFTAGNGGPPSWGEIARHIGTRSKNQDVVRRLIALGYLERLPLASRNIAVTAQGRKWYRDNVEEPPQLTLKI